MSESDESLSLAITKAGEMLGYSQLKELQVKAVHAFIKGNDTFISLPTGYGKSICYILLPMLFDEMRHTINKSIVLVVSPLISLMKDQVATIKEKGVSCIYLSEKCSKEKKDQLYLGHYQIIFVSPEVLFQGTEIRKLICTDVYRQNLVAYVIDEAHCVTKWGDTFRVDFSSLGEIRSIVPDNVHIMALTATASLSTRQNIIKTLNMLKPNIIYLPPVRHNLVFIVKEKPKDSIQVAFEPIALKLKEDRNMGRIIIFCRTYEDVIRIHQYFQSSLGKFYTEPIGSPNYVLNRVVDMYTHCTHATVKDKLLEQFTKPSCLRVIIATIAFGMGINCPDVRQIIHWGIPGDAEEYVQESGRGGRDGKLACAIIMMSRKDLNPKYVSEQMIKYCSNEECRRNVLYKDFPDCEYVSKGCLCCDVCMKSCNCGQCIQNLSEFVMPSCC